MKKLLSVLLLISALFSPLVIGVAGFVVIGCVGLLFALGFAPVEPGIARMAIPVQDAASVFTSGLVDVYREMPKFTGFLRSFFKVKESMTLNVSVAVRRGSEKVAIDVHRYSDGNRNDFSKSTERKITPPLYHEYLTANEHELYYTVIAALANNDTSFLAQMTAELAEDIVAIQDKIERAIELQCSQALEFGVITLNSMTDITFNRKAGSLVAYNIANDFSVGTVDPTAVLAAGCKFIREEGKYQGAIFDAIMGESALVELKNNTIMIERGKIVQYSLDQIMAPEAMPIGGTFHGEVSCGSYKVRLWTYPAIHESANGTKTPYINNKKVVMLPAITTGQPFTLAFGAVPQLIKNGTIPQKGAFLVQESFNEEKGQHKINVKSAPVAILTRVDQVYTIQVLN
jgi:major capsid protein E